MNGLFVGTFFAVALLWVAFRVATWPLPEWSRRLFWVVAVVGLSLPTFAGHRMPEQISSVMLAFMGGLAVSEFVLVGGHQRWTAFQMRRQERAKAARRTARRMAKREARDRKDNQPDT